MQLPLERLDRLPVEKCQRDSAEQRSADQRSGVGGQAAVFPFGQRDVFTEFLQAVHCKAFLSVIRVQHKNCEQNPRLSETLLGKMRL